MAGNPRMVTADTTFTWDHATQRLARGTVLDVPAGSALEEAIGAGALVPLRAVTGQPAETAPEPPEAAKQAAPQTAAAARRGTPQDAAKGKNGSGERAAS